HAPALRPAPRLPRARASHQLRHLFRGLPRGRRLRALTRARHHDRAHRADGHARQHLAGVLQSVDDRPGPGALPGRPVDRLRRHRLLSLPRALLARRRRQRARRRPLRDRAAHSPGIRGRHGVRHHRHPGARGPARAPRSRRARHRAPRPQVRAQGRCGGEGRDLLPRAPDRGEAPQPLRLMAQRWLFKTEPSTYSWADLERDRRTVWDGVKNALALKHLAAVATGDEVLVYHTGDEKAAVGVARVVRGAYPDPKAHDARLVVVDLAPVRGLPRPVTLAAMRANPKLAGFVLLLGGGAIATSSWWLAAVAAAALIMAHLWVVRVEEPTLRARFGAAYLEYLRRVPRWLPRRRR